MRLKPLSEQVIVVFGGSSGIGRETAKRAAQAGARVVVAARGEEGLTSLVDEIRNAGGVAVAVVAEASDYNQVEAVARRAVDDFGGLDTWVHMASTSVYAPFTQTEPDEFKRIVDVNLLGAAYGAKAVIPYLRAAGGALILISSVEAERAIPYHAAYAASKHGVKALADTLRMELRQEGLPISVTNIMPASINTPFFETAKTKLGVEPRGIPPVYEPELVARAVLYAAEHPVRDLVVGGAGKMIISLQRMAPRVADLMFVLTGHRLQRTNRPKPASAPNSLYAPVPGHDRVHGRLGKEARSWSIYTWLQMHPKMRLATLGAAAGALALVAFRARSERAYQNLVPGEPDLGAPVLADDGAPDHRPVVPVQPALL